MRPTSGGRSRGESSDSAGSGMNEAEEAKSGRDLIVPMSQMGRGEALVPYLLPGMDLAGLQWHRVSPMVILRIFLKSVVLTALLLALLLPSAGLLGLIALVVLPIGWLVGYLSYQNLAYGHVEGHIGMRWGVVGRYRSLIPFRKVQAVTLRAGPVERMLGLATVTVFVAGGSPTSMANLTRREAEHLQSNIVTHAATSRFVW